MSKLIGPYDVVNDFQLRRKANLTNDPRHIFYIAMLNSTTYRDYLAKVGNISVQPLTNKKLVSGEMEIFYARDQRRWIRDARKPN